MQWCFKFFKQQIVVKKLYFLSKIQYKSFIKGNSCFLICCMCEQHVISNLKNFLKITFFYILYSHYQFDYFLKHQKNLCKVLNWPLSLKRSLTCNIPLRIQFVKPIVLLLYLNRLLFQIGCWAMLTFDIFSSLICCLHSLKLHRFSW